MSYIKEMRQSGAPICKDSTEMDITDVLLFLISLNIRNPNKISAKCCFKGIYLYFSVNVSSRIERRRNLIAVTLPTLALFLGIMLALHTYKLIKHVNTSFLYLIKIYFSDFESKTASD